MITAAQKVLVAELRYITLKELLQSAEKQDDLETAALLEALNQRKASTAIGAFMAPQLDPTALSSDAPPVLTDR